ncbi:Caspase-2 [Halotydeus destructor]|nr:Caspase-2 [Halotydeus destructor]
MASEPIVDGLRDGGCVSRPSSSSSLAVPGSGGDHADGGSRRSRSPTPCIEVRSAAEQMTGSGIYDIKDYPRGYCLIVNNVNFVDQSMNREGSDRETRKWSTVFRQLGFKVVLSRDLTASKIKDLFKMYSEQLELRQHNAFISVILSHGQQGTIMGVDGQFVRIDKILQNFNNINCPDLVRKPKIFFIQACRGDMVDYGVAVNPESPNVFDAGRTPPQLMSNEQKIIPTWSDMLICYSTVDGHISTRNTHAGSWFGDALLTVLSEDSHNTELHLLLLRTNEILQGRESSSLFKQALEVVYRGWTKRFYFNPGIYET